MERIICTNNPYDTQVQDYRDDYSMYLEESGKTEEEFSLQDFIYCCQENDFDDTKYSLRHHPFDTDIIAIGTIGRWNGTFKGYKIIGRNAENILYTNCDYFTFFFDRYNFRLHGVRHDGTTDAIFRKRNPTITEEQWNNFLDKCYDGTVTTKDITRYTKSIVNDIKTAFGM